MLSNSAMASPMHLHLASRLWWPRRNAVRRVAILNAALLAVAPKDGRRVKHAKTPRLSAEMPDAARNSERRITRRHAEMPAAASGLRGSANFSLRKVV